MSDRITGTDSGAECGSAPPSHNLLVEVLSTEDGDPWGVYAYGHIDPALLTLEMMNEALDDAGFNPIEKGVAEHLWMYSEAEEDAGNPDFLWNWCPAGTEGAIAVTGIDLQR